MKMCSDHSFKLTKGKTASKHLSAILAVVMIVSMSAAVSNADDEQKWNMGTAVNTGLDNGYSGEETIDLDDPHYGWTLGQFSVTGYTQKTTDENGDYVFLKNVGDQVELDFELFQDIDCLNGDENLSIFADTNGYDQYFGTQQYNDCRGLLIIRKTDYQNSTEDPIIYTDYLDAVDQDANTLVQLCEEGDYEVALDYEIKQENYGVDWNTLVSVPTYTNYRIFFTFKVRNGNCMVFPFDTTTGSELQNEAFTENGFYLDLANSRYLEINVQRSVYVEGADGYTEDIRFNKPAADGAEYTEEGIYTITVSNVYTDQTITKVIYVGTDPVMKAYVVNNYSLDEIKSLVEEGYTVQEDGTLEAPADVEEYAESTSSNAPADGTAVIPNSRLATTESKGINPIPIVVIIVIVILAGTGVALYLNRDRLFKKKPKTNDTNNSQNRNEKASEADNDKTENDNKENESSSENE